MIATGEKREEYRETKAYWNKRLDGKQFDVVRFRHGYAKDAPTMEFAIAGIAIGLPEPEWSENDGRHPLMSCWVIQLGQRIN